MITNDTLITYSEQYLLSRGISPESSVFFDIETTGFKPEYSHLYLIGIACRCFDTSSSSEDTSTWTIRQWLAERPQEEPTLLRTFADFLNSFDTVIHFNGKRFDIPYLEEKYKQYGIPSPFADRNSVDLYQDFKPLKSFLKLEHMNQKSLEVFLGLERDDKYDGGKLIPVYRDFCKTSCDDKLHLLLLHNQEDVSGMFTLTALYGYLNFFRMAEPLSHTCNSLNRNELQDFSVEYQENKDGSRNILFSFGLPVPVPVPVSYSTEILYLTLNRSTGKLLIPVLEDTLYYFFEDYKNYYYLPQEDQAIHKSVAAYVDKQYRQQAKKETCYIKQYGLFLPHPNGHSAPAFQTTYKDAHRWMLWKEEQNTAEQWQLYLTLLINGLFAN